VSLPVLLKWRAIERSSLGLLPPKDSLYRLFKRHGLDKNTVVPSPAASRQSCPTTCGKATACTAQGRRGGKLRKSYLFAIIDDHSRLIAHAQSTSARTWTATATACCRPWRNEACSQALHGQRGCVPRHQLKYACARLGIALLHTEPYSPKVGKIERFFRAHAAATPFAGIPYLGSAQRALYEWLQREYHQRVHSSTGQTRWSATRPRVPAARRAQGSRDYFRSPYGERSTRTVR